MSQLAVKLINFMMMKLKSGKTAIYLSPLIENLTAFIFTALNQKSSHQINKKYNK